MIQNPHKIFVHHTSGEERIVVRHLDESGDRVSLPMTPAQAERLIELLWDAIKNKPFDEKIADPDGDALLEFYS